MSDRDAYEGAPVTSKGKARHLWLTDEREQHAWGAIDGNGCRRSICGRRTPRAELSRKKRPRCCLCEFMHGSDFNVIPLTHPVESWTFLHDIRLVRDHLAQATEELRNRGVIPTERGMLLAELEDLDYRLLRLYKIERAGKHKARYDSIIRKETNSSE